MSQPQPSPQKTASTSAASHPVADCPAVLRNDFQQGFSYCFSGSKILACERSPFQEIVIVETARFGKILNIDGYNNRAEADGHIYDEMITHVPMCAHPTPERVLVIGGGDCCTNKEVLRHPGVRRLVMVDIDEAVIRLHRQHIGSGVYAHPKLDLRIGDGAEFIRLTDETFDVIILDATDVPLAPEIDWACSPLYTDAFFQGCFDRLTDQGVFVTQSDGADPLWRGAARKQLGQLRRFFPKAYTYQASIPSLCPGMHLFTVASKAADPRVPIRATGFETQYYSAQIHRAAFVLPPELERYLTAP
jgi:spermidine synthase